MSESDAHGSADEGAEQTEELVNQGRRDALTHFAKYTAPAVLAMLLSGEQRAAAACVSHCG
jgi:hypothetical protein